MKLEDITSRFSPEEGWNDIFLKITDRADNKDSVVYTAKGLFENQIVGLKLQFKKNMEAGLLPTEEINQNAFYRDGIRFFSIGEESDKLLKVLSTLYGYPTNKSFSQAIDGAMAFSLNQIPVDLYSKEHYKFKLFFNDNSENLYCEMFCNLDLIDDIIELHEKDEEYRENLIKTFSDEIE